MADSGVDRAGAHETDDREPATPPVTRAVGVVLGAAVAPLFGVASFLRRARAVHPTGVAYEVTLTVDHPLPLLAGTALGRVDRISGLVRLSHGLGLGPGGSDYRGFALRLFDRGRTRAQDIILVSAATVGGRQRLVRRTSYTCRYCSVVPLNGPQGPVVFHALPMEAGIDDAVVDGGDAAGFRFQLFGGAPRQPWYPCADIVLGHPLPPRESETLRFDPGHADLGLEPSGLINALRGVVYPVSQRGRACWERRPDGPASGGGAAGQDHASAASAARPGKR
jgi:hypothetical protein